MFEKNLIKEMDAAIEAVRDEIKKAVDHVGGLIRIEQSCYDGECMPSYGYVYAIVHVEDEQDGERIDRYVVMYENNEDRLLYLYNDCEVGEYNQDGEGDLDFLGSEWLSSIYYECKEAVEGFDLTHVIS